MTNFEQRQGEVALSFDPAKTANDGSVIFIGRIRTDWTERRECPKNLVQARERGKCAIVEVDLPYRQGLAGLENFSHAYILYWMHAARRDLIMQKPRHKDQPTGTFALRSPVRPNPIALAVVKVLNVDILRGIVEIDAIDCLDETPLLDIKPWIASIDSV